MDQKKMGSFLRELRKESDLTQEQIAEQFNVSGRTVSRWENGYNVPDLSLLVELADFYHVDIRELIDGERNGKETMNETMKETLEKVANYNDSEKEKILNKLRVNSIIVVMFVLAIIAQSYLRSHGFNESICQWILTISAIGAFALSVKSVLYISLLNDRMEKNRSKRMKQINVVILVILLEIVGFLGIVKGIEKLIDLQYNWDSRMSYFINVYYDNNQEKKLIGELDGYQVFVEGLNAEECYVQDINANAIPLEQVCAEKRTTIENLTKRASSVVDDAGCIRYQFENYEIMISGTECVIRQFVR